MLQLSKQDLKLENQLEFPNNNNGAITPSNLRAFNVDMIDSTVNQTAFDSFSGSVASQFAAATGSVTSAITASSLITASYASQTITFTKGDGSTFGIFIPDASGSTVDTGSLLTTASFNAYTQSNDSKVNALIAATGSFAVTVSNTFIGTQTISGSVLPLVNGQGDLGNDTYKWNQVVANGQIKASSFNITGRSNLGTFTMADETFPLSFLNSIKLLLMDKELILTYTTEHLQ